MIHVYAGAYRNDTSKKVYFIPADSTKEVLLYDFNVGVGDTVNKEPMFTIPNFWSPVVVDHVDSISMAGHLFKRFLFKGYGDMTHGYTYFWIEGVGNYFGPIESITEMLSAKPMVDKLICFKYQALDPLFVWGNTCATLGCLDEIVTGIDSFDSDDSPFRISPNPADNYLEITHLNTGVFRLFDLSASLIIEMNIGAENILNLSGFKNGAYFYEIQEGMKTSRGKLVIAH
jgi:hypothetical protein